MDRVTKRLTFDLNRIIDQQQYPSIESRAFNLKLRPIGIGVQGLADLLIAAGIEYDSHQARLVNFRIFETIYYAALDASCQLASDHGPYEYWDGSPTQKGHLQFDLWNQSDTSTRRLDWQALKTSIKVSGLRNSVLIASGSDSCPSLFGGYKNSFEPHER